MHIWFEYHLHCSSTSPLWSSSLLPQPHTSQMFALASSVVDNRATKHEIVAVDLTRNGVFYGFFSLLVYFVNSSFVFCYFFFTCLDFPPQNRSFVVGNVNACADVGQRMHVVVTSSHLNVSFVYKWNGVDQIGFIISLFVRRKRPCSRQLT